MTYGSLETCPSACWWNSHYGVCLLRGMVYDGTTCGDAGPCGDPDNTDSSLPFVPGPDVDTQTTVTFTNTATGASDSHIDSCGDANTLYEGLCFTSSVSGVLTGSFVIVNCDSGCLDGVCAGATPTTCAECMAFGTELTCPDAAQGSDCYWSGEFGRICLLDGWHWDTDTASCTAAVDCVDSDGMNLLNKGTATGYFTLYTSSRTADDFCNLPTDPGHVHELFCTSASFGTSHDYGAIAINGVLCPGTTTCCDGACVEGGCAVPTTCDDCMLLTNFGECSTNPNCWFEDVVYDKCLLRGMYWDGSACVPTPDCTETDAGSLPSVIKGTTTGYYGPSASIESLTDNCVKPFYMPPGEGGTEYQCTLYWGNSFINEEGFLCSVGKVCYDGVCVLPGDIPIPTTCAECMTYGSGDCPDGPCYWQADPGECVLDGMWWDIDPAPGKCCPDGTRFDGLACISNPEECYNFPCGFAPPNAGGSAAWWGDPDCFTDFIMNPCCWDSSMGGYFRTIPTQIWS